MNGERVENAITWFAGFVMVAGYGYALWPIIRPFLPLLALVSIGALMVAALERWAGQKRAPLPSSQEERRRAALARYRAAHTPLELAAKAARGLRIQQQMRPGRNG